MHLSARLSSYLYIYLSVRLPEPAGPVSTMMMPEFWCSIGYYELDSQVNGEIQTGRQRGKEREKGRQTDIEGKRVRLRDRQTERERERERRQ